MSRYELNKNLAQMLKGAFLYNKKIVTKKDTSM